MDLEDIMEESAGDEFSGINHVVAIAMVMALFALPVLLMLL